MKSRPRRGIIPRPLKRVFGLSKVYSSKDPINSSFPISQRFQLVTDIFGMSKRFTEVQNENKDGPVICPCGCKTFECVHIKIAQLGLGVSATISKGGPHKFDIEVLRIFLMTCHDRAISAAEVKITYPWQRTTPKILIIHSHLFKSLQRTRNTAVWIFIKLRLFK